MATRLLPTPANMRAERARHRLSLKNLARAAGFNNESTVSMYLNEYRTMRSDARRSLALAFNELLGRDVFQPELNWSL